jgi:hypothetical protein
VDPIAGWLILEELKVKSLPWVLIVVCNGCLEPERKEDAERERSDRILIHVEHVSRGGAFLSTREVVEGTSAKRTIEELLGQPTTVQNTGHLERWVYDGVWLVQVPMSEDQETEESELLAGVRRILAAEEGRKTAEKLRGEQGGVRLAFIACPTLLSGVQRGKLALSFGKEKDIVLGVEVVASPMEKK